MYQDNASRRIGNITFVWKLPEGLTDQTKQHQTVMDVSKLVPQFDTRIISRELQERYQSIAEITPAVKLNFVNYVTGRIQESEFFSF